MGGNALSKPGLKLSREKYEELWPSVQARLELLYDDVRLVPAYKEKETFGDMDVLVAGIRTSKITPDILLGAAECVHNGNVVSLGLPMTGGLFQLDLIHVGEDEIGFAEVYFGYNDLGNLIGRIAHKMGFKYGHNGLWYVIRDCDNPSTVIRQVLVSRDLAKVFAFLGYSYEKWCLNHMAGFNELTDIFEYVADNPWFDKDIYLLQNRNHIARMRDRKRISYTKFLTWCATEAVRDSYKWNNTYKEFMQKLFLEKAFTMFPEFDKVYRNVVLKHKLMKVAKEKYNGQLVMQLTGLEGKELGQFMAAFKTSWLYEDHFWHWVRVVPSEEIEKAVLTAHKKWRENGSVL